MNTPHNPPGYHHPIAAIHEPDGFGALGERYFEALAVGNASPRTIEGKRFRLGRFATWCAERELHRPQDVLREHIERYQRHVHHYRKADGKPLSIASQRHRLSDLKMWFRYLVKQGFVPYSPADDIALPKLPYRLPRAILSEPEIEKVLLLPDLGSATGLRDRAMMEVLYSCAIRRAELLSLDVNDVDRYRGLLRVNQGKGQKDRIIPIGERALYWVERYRIDSRPQLLRQVAETRLFLSNRGVSMLPGSVSERLRSYIQRAGIDKPGSVHVFRHSTATLMLEHGADIRMIQAMLGHADLSTTQIYTQVAVTQLKAVHERTHPAKLKDKAP